MTTPTPTPTPTPNPDRFGRLEPIVLLVDEVQQWWDTTAVVDPATLAQIRTVLNHRLTVAPSTTPATPAAPARRRVPRGNPRRRNHRPLPARVAA